MATPRSLQVSRSIEPLESRRLLSDTPVTTVETPTTGTVVGNVFRDVNRNGTRESTEPGQSGIKVFLDYNNNGTRDGDAEPIATTSGEGRYTFNNVQVGPAGVNLRLLLAGTNFEQTLPANSGARFVAPVAGKTVEAERFGVAEKVTTPPPVEVPTTLGGIVFTDRNRDGVKNSGEVGRPGVKVFLDTNNDGTRQDGEPQVSTDSAGRYKFTGIAAGAAHVRLNLASTNLVQTKPVSGGYDVTVVANKENRVEIFGVAERITTATVTGTVFNDKNGNGQRDDGETGRAGVRVYLDLNNNGKRDDGEPIKTSASSTGRYAFENVPAGQTITVRLDLGDARLAQTLPADNAGRSIALVAGTRYTDQNFGVREIPTEPKGTLRGLVFNDLDADAKRDDGEKGIAGRIVYIDLNHNGSRDDGERATTTNAEGRYVFENVAAGTYDIRVTLGDFVQTLPASNAARVVTLAAGKTVGDLNFGLHASRD